MRLSSLVLGSSLLVVGLAQANVNSPKVIYGEDNRKDVFESTNASFIELAKGTAAMISSSNLTTLADGSVEVKGPTMIARGMCSTERFAKQITAANCSGFLVAPNLLVTAGHCINASNCSSWNWVFDYKVDHADQASVTVAKSSVYKCSKILAHSLDRTTKDDYALVQLDREVSDRQPLKFRKSGKPAVGAAMVVIGHPTGLPTKIADGANVRKNTDAKFFVANLDTYGGNSGSAVFNVDTEEVEGILVRGETDYVYRNGCQASNVCTNDGCRGEDVTFITNIAQLQNIQ